VCLQPLRMLEGMAAQCGLRSPVGPHRLIWVSDGLIRPSELQRLDGSEPLGAGNVLDFWRWALGDLRMNNARGYLVEYLVAQAVGDRSPRRIEWGPYDAQTADGTLIEIKATAYLQSWATKRLSTPTWQFKSIKSTQVWNSELGEYTMVDPADRVHVWVFALHTCRDPAAYDALDIDQWEFRVVSHRQLLAEGRTSAGLSVFDRLGIEPVTYAELAHAIREARTINEAHPS
jgi:hypothetical protein